MRNLGRRLFLAGLLLCLPAAAQSRVECSALKSATLKRDVRYCALLPPNYDKPPATKAFPILYFLHGLGDNEKSLINTGGWNLIDDLRARGRIGDFLIVTPEGYRSFYIDSADGKVRYSKFFLTEFMPFIEKKYRVQPGRLGRAVGGMSMGGYGALRLAFARPELFGSVSAESAALIRQTPRELDKAIASGTSLGALLGPVFGRPFKPAHWKANDPFGLAQHNAAGIKTLAIYFNCGRSDDYGFNVGAEALHRQLQAQAIKHEYHLYDGDHTLIYFLSHLGEVMEFHSRAFAISK